MLLAKFSDLFSAMVISGLFAVATVAPLPDVPTGPIVHNGFACVRPSFKDIAVYNDGPPHFAKQFAGFRLCRETLPVDKYGYVVFPEA